LWYTARTKWIGRLLMMISFFFRWRLSLTENGLKKSPITIEMEVRLYDDVEQALLLFRNAQLQRNIIDCNRHTVSVWKLAQLFIRKTLRMALVFFLKSDVQYRLSSAGIHTNKIETLQPICSWANEVVMWQ
jgi:hypothetical protein